jgi:hypothetical protein
MKAFEVENYLKEIESESFDYNALLKYDYLFEVKGSGPDDNNLIVALGDLDGNLFETYCKLRGDHNSTTPKLADFTNDQNYCHGYILFTDKDNANELEKSLIVTALKNDVSVKKIPVVAIEEEIKQKNKDLFNSLFYVD